MVKTRIKWMESDVPFNVKRTCFLKLVFCDFFSLFIFHFLGVFGSCWSTLRLKVGEDSLINQRTKVMQIFSVFFFSFFSLPLQFVLAQWVLTVNSPRWQLSLFLFTTARSACQWQFKTWHTRDLPSSGKSEQDENNTWGPGLWRVYPLTRTTRNKLLIDSLTLSASVSVW